MPETILETIDLTKHFGTFRAVDGLNLKVSRACIFGFLGPNGAGKSTTLRMILSLIRPTSGSVRIFGKDLHSHRTAILGRIGAIIEKPDFYPYLTGVENLRLLSRWYGLEPDAKKIEEMLDRVGLHGRGKDPVAAYSHGMKQRLGLAQAMMHDPELYILDEPTTGLDPKGIIELRELILDLKRVHNKTVILSSHILSEIELIADDMVIIDRGKAMVQGPVRQLLSDQDLSVVIECNTPVRVQDIVETKFPGSFSKILSDSAIEIALSHDKLPQMAREIVSEGVLLYSLEYKRRLEDYFLKLTQNAGHAELDQD
jgi:ABC-type multidrug transport system ATPase subunit